MKLRLSSLLVLATVTSLSACTRTETRTVYVPQAPSVDSQATVPQAHGPVIEAGDIAPGQAKPVTLSNGADIVVQNLGGKLYYPVEGTFANDSFDKLSASIASKPEAEREAILNAEIDKVFAKVRAQGGIPMKKIADAAYFNFWLPYQDGNLPAGLIALKKADLDHDLLLNPVAYDRDALKDVKALTPAAEGMVPRADARAGTSSYSGLERIHAPEFVDEAQADIGGGAQVNGSMVKIGITDTGITLNHPTFLSADGKTVRIQYLKDYTREGRVYFNPSAKFEVSVPSDAGSTAEDLVVNAQVIVTPKLPTEPAGDTLSEVKDLKIKVSPELRQILLTPGSGAKLGILQESVFQGDEDKVDINENGKTDDKLYLILVPGATPDQDVVYFDASGTADFRNAKPLGDWNKTRSTIQVSAEKFGFEIQTDKLPKADGSGSMDVVSASVVGFDPGNHGSHVSGIAAGSKTIQNDATPTLARGVAPEATILLDRVCANNGGCGATEAMTDLAVNAGAEVINMSLGGLSPFNDGYGVQETLVNRLTSTKNVLFVISAGNSGPGRQTVGSPSVARLSLSVGAAASMKLIQRQYQWPSPILDSSSATPGSDDDTDFMLFFSSRGPTAAGGFKPNIAAPGTELSSVELNPAPGARGGLDVYWGTSMAAPTTTGAYALFLDAIKKYNLAHADKPLATDAVTLRNVLIQSARPFDMDRFDPATGERTTGQYTWIDEGKGMIDLPAAWKLLFALRDNPVPSAVKMADGTPVDLDYQVITSVKGPNGIAYDGSRTEDQKSPAFGTGLYLDFYGTETLKKVYIQRRLPERLASSEVEGDLRRQLETTKDEFVLKTTYYGSDKPWLKAGVREQLNCAASDTANLTVIGQGVNVAVKDDGTGSINEFNTSTLNICVDRDVIAHQLPAGDNGALIEAYRVVDGKAATLPSFTVPVYVTVPHQSLVGSNAYEVSREVTSLGVSRNYVNIPAGTSLVKVTLEVPALKTDDRGLAAQGEECSGVELMALEGENDAAPFKTRLEARIANCDASGAPITDAAKRQLSFVSTNPKPGIWDLHVFGQYRYAHSKYKLRVDYVTAASSVSQITGPLAALTGSLDWNVKESSLAVLPDNQKSKLELTGLKASTQAQVQKDQHVIVASPLADATTKLRAYPDGTKSVTITTGGSPGNDIDLSILECPATAKSADDPACTQAGQSGGPTDEESVTFTPKAGKLYAARVDGYDVKDAGNFTSTETLTLAPEQGSVTVGGAAPAFVISYAMSPEQLATSKLATSALFTSGQYDIVGDLTIETAGEMVLGSVPIDIKAK